MDGHHDIQVPSAPQDAPSEAIAFIAKCLIGERRWRGEARAIGGIFRRRFAIESSGEMLRNEVLFRETMTFDDGEIQQRSWRLFDTSGGVSIEADDTHISAPGVYAHGAFKISYKSKMGGVWFGYTDIFEIGDGGEVRNRGVMKFAGLPVMRIEAVGREV